MRIGIVGSGVVGQALARGYTAHGHQVRVGTRKPQLEGFSAGSPAEVAEEAELVVLAVAGSAAVEVVTSIAPQLNGKVLIDATNPLDFSSGAPRLFVGHTNSLGEQVQAAAPGAKVVKAYNTVGNTLMVDPQLPDGPPTMFIGGNDQPAKDTATELLQDTGWEVVDLGGIHTSRYLEPLALVWVVSAMSTGNFQSAFRLLRG